MFWVGLCLVVSFQTKALDLSPDGVSVSYGQYLEVVSDRKANYNNYRAALQWDWGNELYRSDSLTLNGYFELAGSSLQSRLSESDNPSPDGHDSATVISFSPVLRFSSTQTVFATMRPFIDIGAGGAWFSEKDLEKKRKSPINMGSHWLFELRLAAGVTFGQNQEYEIHYGWLHYSNANIASQNESIDFHAITFGWRW